MKDRVDNLRRCWLDFAASHPVDAARIQSVALSICEAFTDAPGLEPVAVLNAHPENAELRDLLNRHGETLGVDATRDEGVAFVIFTLTHDYIVAQERRR